MPRFSYALDTWMSQLSLIETNANLRLLTYVGGGWAHETRVRVEDKFWCLVCSAVYPYCAEEKSKGGAKSTLIIFGGRNWGPRGSREACTKEADWILGRRVALIQEPHGLCFQNNANDVVILQNFDSALLLGSSPIITRRSLLPIPAQADAFHRLFWGHLTLSSQILTRINWKKCRKREST